MALLVIRFALLLVGIQPTCAFLFNRNRALSPTSNVHVDVVNHVNSALDTHASEFHHSWRDYLLLFLLIVLLIFGIYRRLSATFVRRRPAPPSLETGNSSTTTAKY